MTIRANRFNDPALGAAFQNIASLFAPLSAQDTAGYAAAKAKTQQAEQMAWLFNNANDPTASARAALTGVQTFGNTPAGFFATDATNRYGIDTDAKTKLTTNAADNARQVQTNAADNQAGIVKQYMTPRPVGVTDPGLAEGVAGLFGLPALAPVNGAVAPLSETEQKAAERQALAASGAFTPDMQLEAILGGEAPVKVEGPNGPVYSTPGAAARTGAPAYVDRGSQAAPELANYRTLDGQSGTARFDQTSGQWLDTQTQQPLPAGSQTVKATSTGSVTDALGPRPANLSRATQIKADVTSMNGLVKELETTIRNTAGSAGLAASVQSFLQDGRQVLTELAMAAGDNPDAAVSPEALKGISDAVLGRGKNYDPTFRRVHAMLLDLAYMNARLNNPSGEVSRFALEREMEALGQGITGNDQSVLASIGVARERMARALDQASVLQGVSQGPSREEVLGQQPAPPSATGGGTQRMKFDAEGNPIP